MNKNLNQNELELSFAYRLFSQVSLEKNETLTASIGPELITKS